MDPSAAPWRVLDAGDPPTAASGGATQSGHDSSLPAGLRVSPLTLGAALGVVVLVIAAFAFAASDLGGGTLQVTAAGSLPPIDASNTGTASGAAGDASSRVIVVEIAGAVRRPGVFKLSDGARIGDLVEAAGGFGPRLDADRVSLDLNLAARLADGDRVVVPSRGDRASSTSGTATGTSDGGSGSSAGSTVPMDLNRATSAELEALPGIGPVTAGKIITSREEQPFTAVEDLRTRKLVGAKTFDGLKDLVSVP